jgi:hypothetical protein
MERMRRLLREPRQHPASTRRTAATRLLKMRMMTTLSGLPHPWKCSAHPATAVQSASTLLKTTTMSVALPAVTHSTEPASTLGSRAAAPAAHCAKPTTTCPSPDQKEKTRTLQDVATVAREAICLKRHSQHGWVRAGFHSAHGSWALEASSSAPLHRKIPHNSHTTATHHHAAPSADGVNKMPISPPNQRQKLPNLAPAAGGADSTCPSADEHNLQLTAPTVSQKSSAQLPAIWKLGVRSDDLRAFSHHI